MKHPVEAQENGEQGRVIVKFIDEKDGSLNDVNISISVSQSLDQEALRIIKTCQNGFLAQTKEGLLGLDIAFP